MENRKRNVQIIVRVTEDERTLIEEKMRQIPTMNLSAYSRKMLIDRYIIVLERNLRRRKDSLHYSGSVVKTKIQAFYNEPISVAELGRCPH